MKFTSLRTAGALLVASLSALSQTPSAFVPDAHARIVQQIDSEHVVALPGNVRKDLSAALDLGPVEDGLPLRLYIVLQRSPEQQADLDNLLARLQQPTAPEYHKWLTPQQFGARFGASPQDVAKIVQWLEVNGMHVNAVQNNATFIDFMATAGQVSNIFHTQLHYYNKESGRFPALVHDPMIPAALTPVVAGIVGLNKIPAHTNHTKVRQTSFDVATHQWHNVEPATASPEYNDGGGNYNVGPQDLYTIYDVNRLFNIGNLAKNATVAVIEESDIEYGTVNGSTGAATGGDVATFRSLFGVPGTLNMHVYHGYGSVTCNDPGIDPNQNGEQVEAALDAEWANALSPSANLIFMSCDSNPDDGIFSSMMALIDNNLADVMSLSYGSTELTYSTSDYAFQDNLYAQAATQGQTIIVASGDSGSDVADQNTSGTATSGINVSAFGSPLVTVTGGTDFVDTYDSIEGGKPQSTYWSSTNSNYYGNALSYVPETAWNESCASSIIAKSEGYSGAAYCALGPGRNAYIEGDVVGGSGGFSTHYSTPSYQSGVPGYSGSARAQPDIAGFASSGFWHHALLLCDSTSASSACTSNSTFGVAGGTSFVAPYMAGVAGLLVNYTGSRQGLLNPALYALAKAQYRSKGSACFSNGQAANTNVTSSLPSSTCVFNDVTSSNNDVPCQAGATNCFVDSGASYGMLSLTSPNSLKVAYSSTPNYDEVTGIGTVNAYNLVTQWDTAFTSTTALSANPTSISTSQSTTLTASVTGGIPAGYVDNPPAVTGTAYFSSGSTQFGSCTLSGGSCSISVLGTSLLVGSNSMTATYFGSGTYPASNSKAITVNVTQSTGEAQTITFNSLKASKAVGSQVALEASATSGLPVAFSSPTADICTVSGTTATAVAPGTCTVLASQSGNGTYAPAPNVTQSFAVTTTTGLGFIPVTPCRLVDTRNADDGFLGAPDMKAGTTRSFQLTAGNCGLPASASAYSLNVTVVPSKTLGYLALWPTGQPQPVVSTLNSQDGRVVANAAIVPAGTNGAVNVYVTDATSVIIDVNGYFGASGSDGALFFVPVRPCRVEDTRNANGPFGGPILAAGSTRSFTVPSSTCSIPSNAAAYSLNETVVPTSTLGYLTLFPTGVSQPMVSTLNSDNGQVVANAALVPAGTKGAISAYVTDQTQLITDINGYFTTTPPTALVFNAVTPCRVADTRNANGPLGGPIMAANSTRSFPVPSSACGIPSGAAAYAMNVTAVPSGALSYLTLWPTGESQPSVSTLNSYDGQVVANAALVPAGTSGAVDVFVTNQTQVILDIVGYFSTAP